MKLGDVEVVNTSYSELASFRQCQLQHRLSYVEKLRPPVTPPRLAFGSAFHQVMELHYQSIRDKLSSKEIQLLVRGVFGRAAELGLDNDALERLLWVYAGYREQYDQQDQVWEPVLIEHRFDFTLCDYTVDGRTFRIQLRGMVDLVKRHRVDGRTVIVDHKTLSGRDLSKDTWQREVELDDQFTLYHAALVRSGIKIDSAEWNAVRADRLKREMSLDERFARARIHSNQTKLDAVWAEAASAAKAMLRTRIDPSTVYSNPNPRGCSFTCAFQKAHVEARLTGRDIVEVAAGFGFVGPERLDAPEDDDDPGW